MRNRVSLFEDQYKFYKVYKSKKLLCAFVEYMFEDVEPKNLSEKEQIIFESLRERMQKSKQISDWNSKGWQTSKRTKVVKNSEWNNRSELESSDKSKGKSTISQRVSQTPKKDNEVEVEEEVKEIWDNKLSHKENEFELFWKEFPHARKGKKQEAKNNFIKQDSEKVMEEIKLLNWKIKLWLQDAKYIPACERRIRDFVPTSDIIKKQVMEQIVAKHMEMEGMKERYSLLKQDFWEETMNKLVMEYNNKHKAKLSFN